MAKETALTLWLNEDRLFEFEVLNADESLAVDSAGFAMKFMVKRVITDADGSALVTKTSALGQIVISGSFNATVTTNTQRWTVTVLDTDTDTLVPGLCRWEFGRTDAGYETPVGFGVMNLRRRVFIS